MTDIRGYTKPCGREITTNYGGFNYTTHEVVERRENVETSINTTETDRCPGSWSKSAWPPVPKSSPEAVSCTRGTCNEPRFRISNRWVAIDRCSEHRASRITVNLRWDIRRASGPRRNASTWSKLTSHHALYSESKGEYVRNWCCLTSIESNRPRFDPSNLFPNYFQWSWRLYM